MTTLKALCERERPAYLVSSDADWRTSKPPRATRTGAAPSSSRHAARNSALFMSETIDELNIGAYFLDRLSAAEKTRLQDASRQIVVQPGDAVFSQGEPHDGIFIIQRGQVRVYYTAPSGREITLAYWTPGHFVGGPEINGGGRHM
jgi:CRP/FNR family transcriptional regulator, cyclic AMP receptor protein